MSGTNDDDDDDDVYDWSAFRDDSGQIYYHNAKTNETSWEPPDEGFNRVMDDHEEERNIDNEDNSGDNENNENDVNDDFSNEQEGRKTVGNWTEYIDTEKGEPYYNNNATNETVWERPADFDEHPNEPTNECGNNHDVAASPHNDNDSSKNLAQEKSEEVEQPVMSSNWVEYEGDDGRSYFFNTETKKTSWEKPADFEENKSNDDTEKAAIGSTEVDAESDDDKTNTQKDQDDDDGKTLEEQSSGGVHEESDLDTKINTEEDWIEYKTDDGRNYYFNQKTQETSWEKPEGFVTTEHDNDEAMEDDGSSTPRRTSPIPDAQDDDNTLSSAKFGDWVEYKDEDGRSYFYNEKTNETVWERPTDFKPIDDDRMDETGLSPVRQESPRDIALGEEDAPEEEEQVEEEVIDPAVKRLDDAKEALKQPDAIMETGVLSNLIEVIKSDHGKPKNAIQSLSESAHGQTAVCGLLSRWLADLKSQTVSSSSTKDDIDERFQKSANEIREMTQEVVNRIVKEKFTHKGGDSILALSKGEAAFLEDMMDSNRWRKLLIDLSAANKDSALLMYCLQAISKRGYHREIARRINQSEHFPVFNAMLASELAVISKISVSACYDHDTSINLNELVGDLRRTCTSAAYTYMYAFEVLRFQIQKANDDSSTMTDQERLLYARIIRKWEKLIEVLQGDMIDPSTASGSNPLYLKRRLDVACTISDLHQRQRRRLCSRHDDADKQSSIIDGMSVCSDDRNARIESAVSAFLRKFGLGSQIDETILSKMLPTTEDCYEASFIGNLLVKYPISIQALLGYLFKPGHRVGAGVLRNKCARLISLAVLASEDKSRIEAKNIDSNIPDEIVDEGELTRTLVESCELCEQLENMVSFIVTADAANAKGSAVSPGERLCGLAIKWAPVSQGVSMWSRDITKSVEFVNSASYTTISPNIMSLVRIIYLHHPFTRDDVSGVAFQFLKHSNSEVVYQTMNSLKEQSLRLLIFLCMRGEAPIVFDQMMALLKDPGKSPLDASLIRYFISGLLEVVSPPFSIPFIRSFLILLKSPASVEAVKTSYFNEKSKSQLEGILNYLKTRVTGKLDDRPLAKEDTSLINAILSIYHSN